jgi:putative ABC transport system ATP-binding protein
MTTAVGVHGTGIAGTGIGVTGIGTTGIGTTGIGTTGIGVHVTGLVHLYRSSDGADVVALRGIDLDIDPGERVAMLGPSGAGKSTLLSLMGGLLRPSAGRLRVGGIDLGRTPDRELVRLRASLVGTVLQGAVRNLLPYASPRQNVEFARRAVSWRQRRKLPPAHDLLRDLGLDHLVDTPTHLLAGGEMQQVALAVGVANAPGLLLADEPTSQLDRAQRRQVLDVINRVNEFGTTVVVVSHDPEVSELLGRTVTIRDGRVGAEGRRGEDFAVVGVDGSVHLPDRFLTEWPAGTLVRLAEDGDGLRLTRPETEADREPAADSAPEPEAVAEPDSEPEPQAAAPVADADAAVEEER